MDVKFDHSVDVATNAVLVAFDWCDLPKGDELARLAARINNCIADSLEVYKPKGSTSEN